MPSRFPQLVSGRTMRAGVNIKNNIKHPHFLTFRKRKIKTNKFAIPTDGLEEVSCSSTILAEVGGTEE